MATIFFWQDDETGLTESVQFDVVDSEEPEDVATPTDHPVEQGSNITDHVKLEPEFLTVEGIVSNMVNPMLDDDLVTAPVELNVASMTAPGSKTVALDVPSAPIEPSPSGLLQAAVGGIKALFTGGPKFTHVGEARQTNRTVSISVLQQEAPRDRIRDVYDLLLKAQKRRLLVTVQQTHREHFDMLLTRIAKPKRFEDGKAARFSVDLRQIKVADSQTVQAPQPTEARGKTGVSSGSKNGKADPNAAGKETQYESTLSQLIP
jgi:hypothetical protein